MRLDSDVVVNASEKTLAMPEFKGFIETLKLAFSSFKEKAPSNSSFRIDIKPIQNGYTIAIDLASSVLSFQESGEGQSPFTALDRVLVKARRKLELWSVQKNLSTMAN